MFARRQWLTWLLGSAAGAIVGAGAIYVLRFYLQVDALTAVLCLLLFMSLGDLLLVWDNRRAEKAGQVRFWNRATAETAVAVDDFIETGGGEYRGKVRFDGELWSAFSATALRRGQRVYIERRYGLDLGVRPVE